MKRNSRIIEVLSDMLFEQKKTNERLEKLENHQARTNLELSEMRLSFMKVAEKIDEISNFGDRILRLEKKVFL